MKKLIASFICLMIIIQVTCSNISFAQNEVTINSATGEVNLKKKGMDVHNLFSDMKLGYEYDNEYNNVNIKLELKLDNNALCSYRNDIEKKINNNLISIENYPKSDDYVDTESFNHAVDAYMDNLYESLPDEQLPKLNVNVKFDKSCFENQFENSHISIKTTNKEEIGSCDFSKDADSNIDVKVSLSKKVYNRSEVSISIPIKFGVKLKQKTGYHLNTFWDDAEAMLKIEYVLDQKEEESDKGIYSLKKTAPASVTKPFITYTIETDVINGVLNGKTIVDELPDGMTLQTFNVDSVDKMNECSVENGKLYYTFPELNDDKKNSIQKATINYKVYLSKSKYEKLLKDKLIKETFTNRAYLQDKTSKKLTNDSITQTSMSFYFMTKDYEQQDMYGTAYKWKVTLNTYFNNGINSYVVDKIDGTQHAYNMEKGVYITRNPGKTELIHPVDVGTNDSYESLDLEKLDSITTDSNGQKRSVYYKYKDTSEKTMYVLIVPYEEFDNNSVTITYYTKSTGDIDYSDTTKRTYNNVVKFMWDKIDLEGEVINSNFVEIEKVASSTITLIEKTFVSHDTTHQKTLWRITLNPYGGVFHDIEINDTVSSKYNPSNSYRGNMRYPDEYLKDKKPLDAKYYVKTEDTYDSGTAVSIPYVDQREEGKPYYTISKDSKGDKETLLIHVDNIDAKEKYVFDIYTIITDPLYFTENTSRSFCNTVSVKAMNQQNSEFSSESKAYRSLSVNLLSHKEVLQSFENLNSKKENTTYNHAEHITKWSTTANQDFISLNDAKLTEELPIGSSFDKLMSFKVYQNGVKNTPTILYDFSSTDGVHFVDSQSNQEIEAVLTPSGGSLKLPDNNVVSWKENKGVTSVGSVSNINKNTLDITFSKPLDYRIEYEYTTKYDEAYRKHILCNNSVTTTSNVILRGMLEGEQIETKKQEASMKIEPNVLNKIGKFDKDTGSIRWSIYFNKDAVDMEGYTLVEKLKQTFDLEICTMKVESFDVTALGECTNFQNLDRSNSIWNSITNNGSSGFVFKVPSEFKNTPLRFTFDTVISDNVKKSDATNKASIYEESNLYRETPDIIPEDMQDFDVQEFAKASSLCSLFLKKASINKDNVNEQKIVLANAEFELTAYQMENGKWIENTMMKKLRTSKENGIATFFGLQRGILFKISETKAPLGYIGMEEPKYFIFQSENVLTGNYPEDTLVIPTGMNICQNVISNESKAQLEITKTDDNKQPLEGVEFTLSRTDGLAAPIIKETDEDGKLDFLGLDKGNYVLSESKALDGFVALSDVELSIRLKDDGLYEVDMDRTANITYDKTGKIAIVNNYQIGYGRITGKKVDEENQPVKGASIGLYKESELVSSVSSDDKGTFCFLNIPLGPYQIKEIAQPEGYELSDVVIDVSLEEEKNLVKDSKGNEIVLVNYRVQESEEPTKSASVEPSISASVEPSISASVEPSISASVEPSISASVEPSISPSLQPSASVVPKASSTVTPNPIITSYVNPTEVVSVSPTESIEPTKTQLPSSTVTPVKTFVVTDKPSKKPTIKPSSINEIEDSNNKDDASVGISGSGNEDGYAHGVNVSDGENSNPSTNADIDNVSENGKNSIPKTGDSSIPIEVYGVVGLFSLTSIYIFGRKMIFHK